MKGPTQQTEVEYVHSVMRSADALNVALRRFTPPPAVKPTAALAAAADRYSDPAPSAPPVPAIDTTAGRGQPAGDREHPLKNRDLDTGNVVQPAGYRLTDATYATLLHRLAAHPQEAVPPGIKQDILAYYADMSLPFDTRRKPDSWRAVQYDLMTLRAMPTSTAPAPVETYGDDPETTAPTASSTDRHE